MSVSATSSASSVGEAATGGYLLKPKEMGQADFLKLLVAQLTSQDPTNPMENNDFLAQLVQMSALEQNQALQQQLTGMRDDQQLLYANSLLGREVEIRRASELGNLTGIATSVNYGASGPQVTVNGELYDLGTVVSLTENKGVNQYASIS